MWDGEPIISLTHMQLLHLYGFCPQWQGLAIGPPIPFTHGQRAMVDIEAIFVKTREEAVDAMVSNIHNACIRENIVYVEDEWTITSLVLVGGC